MKNSKNIFSPLTISISNSNDLINDNRRRILSSQARKFAENNIKARKLWKKGETYFDEIVTEHEKLFWMDVYKNKLARIKRMKDKDAEANNNSEVKGNE